MQLLCEQSPYGLGTRTKPLDLGLCTCEQGGTARGDYGELLLAQLQAGTCTPPPHPLAAAGFSTFDFTKFCAYHT